MRSELLDGGVSSPRARLARLLGSGPRRPAPLVEVALAAPLLDPVALVDEAPPGDLSAWLPPTGPSRIGAGTVLTVEAEGERRFARAELALTAPEPRRVAEPGCEGPLDWTGGAAFVPGAASPGLGDLWFHRPAVAYERHGERARWVLTVRGDAGEHALDVLSQQLARATRWARRASHWLPPRRPSLVAAEGTSRREYLSRVLEHRERVRRGLLLKGVPARHLDLWLAEAPRPSLLLGGDRDARLGVLVRRGEHCLLAVTPELLVRSDGLRLESEALAGTARGGDADAAAALLESRKDGEEHQVVVDALRATLGSLAALDPGDAPRLRAAGPVVHLVTGVSGTLHRPIHVLDLAARLHPSPAVAGAPRDAALRCIAETERTPRGWYTGLVGSISPEGTGELWVALRAAELSGRRLRLWAGAGVVAGSEPEAEWEETERKLSALGHGWEWER